MSEKYKNKPWRKWDKSKGSCSGLPQDVHVSPTDNHPQLPLKVPLIRLSEPAQTTSRTSYCIFAGVELETEGDTELFETPVTMECDWTQWRHQSEGPSLQYQARAETQGLLVFRAAPYQTWRHGSAVICALPWDVLHQTNQLSPLFPWHFGLFVLVFPNDTESEPHRQGSILFPRCVSLKFPICIPPVIKELNVLSCSSRPGLYRILLSFKRIALDVVPVCMG